MADRVMPRVQEVLMPILRSELEPDYPGLMVTSWVPNVDLRKFPVLNVRRLGGAAVDADLIDRPVIELTSYAGPDLPTCEELLLDARQTIWEMVRDQTVVEGVGYLHSYTETMGPTQFDSTFDDVWRVQMLIALALRPARSRLIERSA